MRKKLIAVLVAVVMVLCMIPFVSSAAPMGLIINDNAVTQDGDVPGLPGASVEFSNGGSEATLTLNNVNATFKNLNEFFSVYLDKLTINVVGTNTLTAEDTQGYNDCDMFWAFPTDAEIIVQGGGTLTIDEGGTSGDGITADCVTVKDVTLNITNARAGITGNKEVNFEGAAKVTIDADDWGVVAQDDINFNLGKGGFVDATVSSNEGAAVIVESIETITLGANNVITTPKNGYVCVTADREFIAAEGTTTPALAARVEGPSDPQPANKTNAKTGDEINLGAAAIMLAIAGLGVGIAARRRNF